MPLLTRYGHLKKKDQNGTYRLFAATRAIGLAVEKGHRLARDVGLGGVSAEGLGKVQVVGDLKVFQGGTWKACGAASGCSLALREPDALCALTVLSQHRTFLSDMGLNIWLVGHYSAALRRSLDLVGDFSTHRNHGITGKVWLELKAYTDGNFECKLRKAKAQMEEDVKVLHKGNAAYKAAVLLVSKLSKAGGAWERPAMVASLWKDGAWIDMSPGAGRGPRAGTLAGSQKPSLAEVWEGMSWDTLGDGKNVGCVTHFLQAVGFTSGSPGKRSATFNKILQLRGHPGRLFRTKIESKQGQKPWVGTKAEFRQIYKHL